MACAMMSYAGRFENGLADAHSWPNPLIET